MSTDTPSRKPNGCADERRILSTRPSLPQDDLHAMLDARRRTKRVVTTQIGPAEATLVPVGAGAFVRIMVLHRPQVGELRIWARDDLTRQLSPQMVRQRVGSQLRVGSELVSGGANPTVLASVSGDSVSWYGLDPDGARVHDLAGSPCDYRSSPLVAQIAPESTCRRSVAEALASAANSTASEMRSYVGDGIGLFLCSGFARETGRYFSKPTPARGGDYFEFYARESLLVAVSACPVGDGTEEADLTREGQLRVDVLSPESALADRRE